MSAGYDSHDGLVVVAAEIEGPVKSIAIRLALDTGATRTLISTRLLVAIGYDLALIQERSEMITGSGVEYVPRINLGRLTSLGLSKVAMSVIAHTLPPGVKVDGLLGVDFFADRKLTIDFRVRTIDVE